ncbi:porin [Pseudomonas citronellolis]|uniref:Porin n=2 Tax=Pseudomonas citronellolis TaxID=53408 RepID=A0A1A9KB59_9PSED|nr:porin [Pseudomonas citronellolis]
MNARYPALPVLLCICSPGMAADDPDFLKDASATLQTRNYYFQRNHADIRGTEKPKAEEWAQGFILAFKSGYTPGLIGFGVDLTGTLGIKLDSGPGRVGSGLLPIQDDGDPADEYSRLGPTLKARLSKTELRIGELQPDIPVLAFSDIRLLPPSFQGVSLSSEEIAGLKLQGGHIRSTSLRNEAGDEKLLAMLGHIPQRNASSDAFNYLGGDYQFDNGHTLVSGWYAQLKDIYRQSYVGMKHKATLGPWSLAANLGLYDSIEDGEHLIGNVDNRALHGMLSAGRTGHTLSLGYQRMFGETAFPRVFANIAPLSNELPTYDFSYTDETSYQLRYDYDFAAAGVPGLAFTARYVTGNNVSTGLGYGGKDTERDLDLFYVVQSGTLKGFSIRLRDAAARSNYRTDIDEYRVVLSYTWKLL